MAMVKMYGKGGFVLHDVSAEYRMRNGVLEIPEHLIPRALAAGLSRHPLPSIEEESAESAPASIPSSDSAPEPIDRSRSDDDLFLDFSIEAVERGYTEDAAAAIARDRIRHLRAGGDGYNRLPEGQTLEELNAEIAKARIPLDAPSST